MFHYVGVTYQNGKTLVTPDYASDFSKMAQFDSSLGATWCEVKLGPGQLITGAVGVHDMVEVYNLVNPETNAKEKSFAMRGITWIVSNVNETAWTVAPVSGRSSLAGSTCLISTVWHVACVPQPARVPCPPHTHTRQRAWLSHEHQRACTVRGSVLSVILSF